ncbi:hypothetical protein NE236_29390 [Actinoallomurus purpureus]|uniref:DUF2231 domain-containing protein n=1 Tax=Actinoallomurus purpureus TaxID=478114 RepID=UPI00209246CC|nr:DUF2231 domain-containing protein [Actinoallomurus purpureus]MCO6009096.1 hypothetical protein [Actinoallomurus purpureus]
MTETALPGSDTPESPPARRFFPSDPSLLLLAATVVVAVAVTPIELSKAFGLPAHAIFLHVPVVFVPILAGVVIALAVRPVWQVRYGLAAGIFAIVTMAATVLTAGAGEKLRDARTQRMKQMAGGRPAGAPQGAGGAGAPRGGGGESSMLDRHAELGSQLRLLVALLTVLLIVLVILARYRAYTSEGFFARPVIGTAVAVLAVVVAIVSAIWVVRTGHLGAQMTWHEGSPGKG